MAGGMKELKKRVVSASNTRKLTKALKMVSAVKLRRAQEAVTASRPYSNRIAKLSERISKIIPDSGLPLLAPKLKINTKLIVLLTSDRGKCGGFNSNISKFAEQIYKKDVAAGTSTQIWVVGTKGCDFFKSKPYSFYKKSDGSIIRPSYPTVSKLADQLMELFLTGKFDSVSIVYNEFKSALVQKPMEAKLLPITGADVDSSGVAADDTGKTLFEPDPKSILGKLVPESIRMKVYQAVLESLASEHGARMNAMENATKNAGEMIKKLTLQYNKVRQAAITTELLEITSGAEALNG